MGEYWSIGMDIVSIIISIDHRYNSTEHRSAISFASLLIIPLTSILCYIGFRFFPLMDSVVRSTSNVPDSSQGFSEVCGLRVPETVHFWQPTAALVGFLFWLRWLRQLYARITMCPSQTNSPSTEYWIRTGGSGHWDCCQIYSAKLVLEVFGAGGAIWVR